MLLVRQDHEFQPLQISTRNLDIHATARLAIVKFSIFGQPKNASSTLVIQSAIPSRSVALFFLQSAAQSDMFIRIVQPIIARSPRATRDTISYPSSLGVRQLFENLKKRLVAAIGRSCQPLARHLALRACSHRETVRAAR
jgi:hypothetical protein